jgi:hypothetical protein
MLQGNPFETEKWVQDRTQMVQYGMEKHRQPWSTQLKKAQERWLPRGSQGPRKLWWLPATVALGTLLSLALGG